MPVTGTPDRSCPQQPPAADPHSTVAPYQGCRPAAAGRGLLGVRPPGRAVELRFQRGDGTNPRHYTFSSDPRTIRDIVAAFEMAWDRATPHEEYKTEEEVSRTLGLSRPRWSRAMPGPSRVWRVRVAVVRPDEDSESDR